MYVFSFRTDPKEYALKQIEGAGLSMSACREIAVSEKYWQANMKCVEIYYLFPKTMN